MANPASLSSAPDPSLQGRVVIVTGGVRGLGREMVLALLEAGARVVATGTQASPASEALAADAAASGAGDRLLVVSADVTDYAACQGVLQQTEARFGPPAVLVNNAGRGMRLVSETFNVKPTRFWETAPTAWRAIIDANVNGSFHMAHVVVPGMVARGFGKLINVSTSDPTMVRVGYSPYGPSKAALEAMSRVWTQDLAGTGVDVNVYLPGGAADTDLLPPSADKKGADGQLLPASVMRRGIGWLCSDASSGMSGGRYIARLWDTALPPAEAARGALAPGRFMAAPQ